MRFFLSLPVLLLVTTTAFAAGHTVRSVELAPHIETLGNRIFSGPLGVAGELSLLRVEYGEMPDGAAKDALGVVLKAASANNAGSANVLFSDNLDARSAAAAGR